MMRRIVQWNCKGPRARHEEVELLMNKSQPSCICLQEVMPENVKYNLVKEYKFYAIILPVQRSKGGTAIAIKKGNSTQKTKHMNGPSDGGSGTLHDSERKNDNMLNISTPSDLVMEEGMRNLLKQLPSPMILLGDFNAHNPLWGSEKISIRGRMLEKILARFNLLKRKEKTYYRAYDGCKSTINLTLANLTIAPEYKWSKKYNLRWTLSGHYPIIIKDEREISTKQNQRWSLGRAHWIQFQK